MFSHFNSHPSSGIKPIAIGGGATRKGNLVLPLKFEPVIQDGEAKANMSRMFEYSNAYTGIDAFEDSENPLRAVNLDISNFKTSGVADMSHMFEGM